MALAGAFTDADKSQDDHHCERCEETTEEMELRTNCDGKLPTRTTNGHKLRWWYDIKPHLEKFMDTRHEAVVCRLKGQTIYWLFT